MNLKKIIKKPRLFRRIFGITPEEFKELTKELELLWEDAEYRRKTARKRKYAIGGGRRYVLTFEQSLAMYLMYLRKGGPYVFIGMVFRIDVASVTRYYQKLRPVVTSRMKKKITIEPIDISQEEILDLIADATEQETERRGGSGYSGKKKRQTIKTQAIVDTKGKIVHISHSVPGNVHDKRLYDETGQQADIGDLGYLGTTMSLPHKSSKLHPLTDKQKNDNTQHSRTRIIVEHVFATLKQWRILTGRFRGCLDRYNDVFMTIAGLYNLRRGF